MKGELLTVIIVVATALAFDFTNGFHDTANVVATSISTRAMAPRLAVAYAALLNFVGAFISLKVAATVASDVVDPESITLLVVFGGLVGAIAWNLTTWYFGLPSSSSHALIGGIVGAMLVANGPDAVFFEDGILGKVMLPALVAPTLAFVVGGASILALYRITGALRPGPVSGGFRGGQVVSGGLLALAHGTNDAQKTMGIITLALVAGGAVAPDSDPPTWVILTAGLAIALGTYLGGWRIIRTMGKGLTDLQPQQGFAAQTSAATVILASSHIGFSLSTTHSVSGAVMGAGLGRKGGVVRWSTATRMFVAWGLTLPAAALVGALAESVTGLGDWGTGVVAVFLIASSAAIWKVSRREVVDATNVNETDEPAGVVTTAIAAVTPPPAGTVTDDLTATIPAPAGPAPTAEPAAPPAAV